MNLMLKLYKKWKNPILNNLKVIFLAFIMALLLRTFIAEAYKIPSGSMIPTLFIGDHVVVNKIIYGIKLPILDWKLPKFKNPDRGDIVVFKYPKYISPGKFIEFIDFLSLGMFRLTNTKAAPRNFIKRLITKFGDTLEIKDQILFINNKKINQIKYINQYDWNKIKNIKGQSIYGSEIDYQDLKGNQLKFYESVSELNDAKKLIFSKNKEFQVLKEFQKEKQYLIQVKNKLLVQDNKNLPLIYIPKKNDTLHLSLIKDVDTQSLYVLIKINNEKFRKVRFHLFFNIESDLLKPYITYDRYYNKFLFNHDNGSPILDNMSLMEKLMKDHSFSYKFKHNYYFFMGDNRTKSWDSRHWGFVSQKDIMGKPILVYYPFSRFKIF